MPTDMHRCQRACTRAETPSHSCWQSSECPNLNSEFCRSCLCNSLPFGSQLARMQFVLCLPLPWVQAGQRDPRRVDGALRPSLAGHRRGGPLGVPGRCCIVGRRWGPSAGFWMGGVFGCLLDPLLQGRAYVMSNQLPLTSEAIDQVFGRAWNQDHGSAYRFTVPHAGTGQQLVKIWQVKIQVDVSPFGGGVLFLRGSS